MQHADMAELALHENADELADLYEHAPCGYHSLDSDGLVVRMNGTELDWLGYSRDEIVRRIRLVDLVSPPCQAGFLAAFSGLVRSGAKINIESELMRQDGTLLPVQISSVAVTDRRGRFLRSTASVVDITDRRRAEQKAREYAAQLQALSRRVVEVQDRERRWLAGELHDRVGQNLTALNLNLSTIKCGLSAQSRRRVGARVEDCLRLVEETVDSTFDLMAELRPAVLDDYGLLPMLRRYAEQFAERTGVPLAVSGNDPNPRLAQTVETTLFRIAQEACTNIARHAGARQAAIRLDAQPGLVRLEITDDGCGFDPGADFDCGGHQGWGLLIMRERAEAAGGRLAIESAPGQVTRITVEIRK